MSVELFRTKILFPSLRSVLERNLGNDFFEKNTTSSSDIKRFLVTDLENTVFLSVYWRRGIWIVSKLKTKVQYSTKYNIVLDCTTYA